MTNDFINSRQKIQGLQYPGRRSDIFAAIVLILVGVVLGLVAIAFLRTCDKLPEPVAPVKECRVCHYVSRHAKMAAYFSKSGNQHPAAMATAVLSTTRPRLLAAIAVKGEKNTPYTVRHGGYKGQHAGAWQVNERLHGKVPHDPVGQALQADRLLADLTHTKPIRSALSEYGGDSTDKYQRVVLAELQKVP